ncbi:multidrug resistance-associated protein 5 [Tanacetum coccineum]
MLWQMVSLCGMKGVEKEGWWMTAEKTFRCISLVDEHTCVRNFNFGAFVNYKWIAKIFGDKIRANPSIRFQSWVHCKVGSDCDPDGKTYFDRFYVCFVGLADRWKAGCRKLIALDGLVNVENKDNWTWFLELLEEDLCCSRGNGLTLMSDQHKGPINAVEDLFWAASKASYPQLFNKIMDKIKSANPNAHKFWHVIPAGRKLFEVRSGSEGFTIDEGKRTCSCRMWQLSGLPCVHSTKPDQSMYFTVLPPKPRKMLGRPKKKSIRAIGKGGSSTRVSKRGPVRDEGASGTRGDAIGSRGRGGRGGAVGSRGGASGSIGRGAGRSGDANGSRGRGTAGSRGGASGSRGRGADEPEQCQDEPEKTQAEPQQTQHEPEQTQVEDQVEQTEDQAEIDLTQVEQTQEQTQEQVQPQEQPQQVALRMPSVRILQRKLGKQGSSQNTALNLD